MVLCQKINNEYQKEAFANKRKADTSFVSYKWRMNFSMLKMLKNFTKKEVILIIMTIALIVVQVWLELKMPDYMSEITKLVETEGSQMSDVLNNGKYMLLCALGSLVSSVIVGYLVTTIAANLSKNIRKKLFDKVQDMAVNEVKRFSTRLINLFDWSLIICRNLLRCSGVSLS